MKSAELNVRVTNDKPVANRVVISKYDELFESLSENMNCVVCQSEVEMMRTANAMRKFVKTKRGGKGFSVISCAKYPTDKKPRVWLIFPESTTETKIKGNWPKGEAK